MGLALEEVGRVQEAIGLYKQALQLTPDFAEAHNSLGGVLVRMGSVPEAIGHYEQALRNKPDYAEAQNRLARLRAVR